MDEITFDRERKLQVHSDLSKVALDPSSDVGLSRPALATVLYDAAESCLVAANGFSMAVVGVQDQPLGNEDCLIPAEALKMAYQTRKPIELSDCGAFFRVGSFLIAVPKELHFLGWRAIADEGKIARRFLVALDIELLWKLVSGLRGRRDGRRYNLVILSQATRDGVLRCQPVWHKDDVGYLMPVHAPQEDEDRDERAERFAALGEAEFLAAEHFGYSSADLAAHAEAMEHPGTKAILQRLAMSLRAIEQGSDGCRCSI